MAEATLFYRVTGLLDPDATVVPGDPLNDPDADGYKIKIYVLVAGAQRVSLGNWTRAALETAFNIPANDPDLDTIISGYAAATDKNIYMMGLTSGFTSAEADDEDQVGMQTKANFFAYLATFE